MITVTITGDKAVDIVSQLANLFGMSGPATQPVIANGPLPSNGNGATPAKPTLVEKDNVTTLPKTAKPKKGKAATPEPDPEPEPEEEPDPELEADGPSIDDYREQLTLLYQGGDADTRAKIKAWRDEQGIKLLRDLNDTHLAAAQAFLEELVA